MTNKLSTSIESRLERPFFFFFYLLGFENACIIQCEFSGGAKRFSS